MSKEIYISSTPHETRLAITEADELSEIYYERENEYTLAGSIYNGRVTRVLPGMQSAFVDIGLERDAFLYITDFLEEAADSAEFDAEAGGRGRGEGRRGGRERTDENAGGERGAAVSETEAGEARVSGNGRDRQGRRRRGGREDRPTPMPAAQNEEIAADEAMEAGLAMAPFPSADELRLPAEDGPDAADREGDAADGAAEGSRRWRGRRGRRRSGRGEPREESPSGTTMQPDESIESAGGPPDPSSGYDLQQEVVLPDVQGSAAPESGYTGDAEDAARPSREGRGRRGNQERGVRAPRGFAPRHNLYLASEPSASAPSPASAEDAEDTAGAGPVVLPGESISRYRQGTEAEKNPQASVPAPAVETASVPAAVSAFELAGQWDGGAVLPGETLRPRSPRSEADAAPGLERRPESTRGDRDGRSRDGRGRDGRRDSRGRDDRRREDRGGRGGRSSAWQPSATPQAEPAAGLDVTDTVSIAEMPVSGMPEEQRAPVEQTGEGPSIGTPVSAVQAGQEAAPAPEAGQEPATVTNEAAPRAEQTTEEYEPTEARASLRFDPQPPRSFRQPSDASTDGHEEQSIAHTITPLTGELAPLQEERNDLTAEPSQLVAEAESVHEMTSIQADGAMLSASPASEVTRGADEATGIPAEEKAAGVPSEELAVEEADSAAEPFAGSVQGSETEFFEDEGEMEVEDFHTTLHAAAIEEMDDEEETLEGAADLGSMLQEMSIDEITQVEPELADADDDFAFEEEDSIEDPVFVAEAPEARQPGIEAVSTERPARSGGEESNGSSRRRGRDRRGGRGRLPEDRGTRDQERSLDAGDERSRVPNSGYEAPAREERRRHDRRDREERGGREDRGYRPGRREGHRSAQVTNLPAISDLLKPGQEVLVQIAKEPIAKKGARITSHIALPGRFLVFMPTVNHTGVSRKIESDGERRRLKDILLSEKGDATGGFIVRTAAAGATEEELRSDLRFLLNLWADIKQRSEGSKSPALIYHDLNLVERILRDQVTDTFSAIWVDTETEYERVLRFLQRFQPSLIRRVKLYTKDTPLFEQFGLTEEINKALRSKVWLKSGGSIVINQTEALVAIDINTGKYVGKTARLEDTIVKTNLDAIPEIVRQIRLRDLGGIIIIDFIDMDERKNRHRVMAALEEELKKDRAPSKVLQFNDFGLVAITRKRVKQSLERTLSTPCTVCTGTGMVKSPITVCNDIFVEMRKMQRHLDRGDVMLRVNPEVVKQLKAPNARWLPEMEELVGKTILVKSDPALHPEQFDIH